MSYKNHKDQKLLSEAYNNIQEAAPVGLGSRFGNWAAQKALKYVPFTGGVKAKLQGKQEFNTEVNKLKNGLYKYMGKYDIKNITPGVLGKFLQANNLTGKTVTSLTQMASNPNRMSMGKRNLEDDEINEYILNAVRESGQPDEPSPAPRIKQQQQPRQQQSNNQQLPNIPLEQMDPNMRNAWLTFYQSNPQAWSMYMQRFGYPRLGP